MPYFLPENEQFTMQSEKRQHVGGIDVENISSAISENILSI
jgi:hypothetical protein